MSSNRQTRDQIERAAAQIRDNHLPDDASREIAERVWERLENRTIEMAAAEIGTIRGCDDYQALVAPFVAGSLAPSRALLLEDHTRHCVPCRRALKAARSGEAVETAYRSTAAGRQPSVLRWAAAAALALVAVGTGYLVWSSGSSLPYGAVVESAGGGLYRAATLEPVTDGSEVAVGERLRTAPGESAVLRLADGSIVEVRERSELAVDAARRGTTLRIERGDVIVEAAPQGSGRLFVSTDDCLVSVKGTIFAVGHGTKGSHVSVIEGEVQVDYSGEEHLLHAGQRTTTYASYGAAPIIGFGQDLAWSHNVDRYLELLREVTELRQALARDLPRPGLRYSSRLLALAPDDMAFYAAFPNLAETLVEANRIVQERIAGSALLSAWWESQQATPGFTQHLELASSTLSEAGSYLGNEIVVTAGAGGASGDAEPLVLAELLDAESMRTFLEAQMDGEDRIAFYDPSQPADDGSTDGLVVWLGEDTLIAASSTAAVAATVARIASAGGEPTGFKNVLTQVYNDGAEILIAADIQQVAAFAGDETAGGEDTGGGVRISGAESLGLLDARHLILQQKRVGERIHNDAVLAFDGPRRGVAAWLAAPAPMGALRYISPDAKLAAAAVVKRPVEIFDEMLDLARAQGDNIDAELESAQGEIGFNLREDIAAALGGEVAVALDGPVVPEPAWKVIVEVYDPSKLTWAIEQAVAKINDQRQANGEAVLVWSAEDAGGRTYYSLSGGAEKPFELTFDEGYLIAAPNRALIDRAIRFRQSGYTLESSSRFASLLPEDGRANFSALFYQDALSLLEPLAAQLATGNLSDEQKAALEALSSQTEPTLAYAYGEESRIVFAARGIGDLFASGLPALLGMGMGLNLDQLQPASQVGDGDQI